MLNERKLYRLDMMDLLAAPVSSTKGLCQNHVSMSEETKAAAFQTVEHVNPIQESPITAVSKPLTVSFDPDAAEPFSRAEQSRLKDQNT